MEPALGSIILAGGQSRRMGTSKAELPFGEETLLARVARICGEVCAPVVVVAAPQQRLPELPKSVVVVRDEVPDGGPLVGLATGLKHVLRHSLPFFLTGCDFPLLSAPFICRMHALLTSDFDAAVPQVEAQPQPLAGVYRTNILPVIEQQLAVGNPRLLNLLGNLRVRKVVAAELRDIDPHLHALRNVNTPADYEAALKLLP